ncbi:MAG: ferritin-like domain-containing protein [Bryobacteraceae bacterium]
MALRTLKELFVHELQDLYSAEKQLVKALPKMAKAASSAALKAAFETHLTETQGQVERLEQVFKELGETSGNEKCKGMEGLIEEGSKMIAEDAEPAVKDAGLIVAAQKAEHYEIAGYGSVCVFAELLGLDSAKKLLKQTMAQEELADRKLTDIAQKIVNKDAIS